LAEQEPEHGAASPLTWLLEEEAAGDRQLEHAVFLSYTLDLAFFEAVALGLVRSLGARVTVVGDAWMSSPDPRAVRQAGRAYLAGLADMPGAFHPKLVVLAGERRCLVAIGSGNTTLAGWQNNAELWTVFRGTPEGAPAAIRAVAGWLRVLPGQVPLSRGVVEALRSAAARLESFPETDGPQVLGNLERPLLQLLPLGPVDELRVSAPFHDPGTAALTALVGRLRPKLLTVALQPGRTMVDGPALARLIDRTGGRLVSDAEHRYRHGKLIEWTTGVTTFAVTGSANLSSAALRGTPGTGGNCELVVLSTVARSLMPQGRTVPAAEAEREGFSLPERTQNLRLLGATLVDGGLLVELARGVMSVGWLEFSDVGEPPSAWRRLKEVLPGLLEVRIPGQYAPGSRVRLASSDDSGAVITSQIVLVADLDSAARPVEVHGSRRQLTVEELLGEPELVGRFMADLATLRVALAQQRTSTAPAGLPDAGPMRWQAELDSGTNVVGLPLIRFALGRPAADRSADDTWTEDLDVDESNAGLEDDTAEQTVMEDEARSEQVEQTLREEQLRKLRRWGGQLAAQAEGVGTIDRLLPARMLLTIIAMGAWESDDSAWCPLVADVLVALGREESPPAEGEGPLGSIAAVGLTLLRMHTPRYDRGSEAALRYLNVTRAVEHLLPATDRGLVAEYTAMLEQRFGSAVEPDAVWDLASEVVQDDPIADAIRGLEEQGKQVHADHPSVLHVMGDPRNPAFAALEAIAAAQEVTLSAWARNSAGRWALLVWRDPDLYRIELDRGVVLWRHYRCNRRITPRALVHARDFELADRVRRPAMMRPIPEAVELMRGLGVELVHGIACPLEDSGRD
jgi:hypothetical protein